MRLAWDGFRPSATPPLTDLARELFRQEVVQADQFTDYITVKLTPATDAFDVLGYWKKRGSEFPNHCKIARKHLAVCASSIPSERSFLQARLFIPYLRTRGKPNLFRTSMLLWSMKRLKDEDMSK